MRYKRLLSDTVVCCVLTVTETFRTPEHSNPIIGWSLGWRAAQGEQGTEDSGFDEA
jgi:hypothetical protein